MAKDNGNPLVVRPEAGTAAAATGQRGTKVSLQLKPLPSARKRLCDLLRLRSPADEQIWSDAVAEIERLRGL